MVAQSSSPNRIVDIDNLNPNRARVTLEMTTKETARPAMTDGLFDSVLPVFLAARIYPIAGSTSPMPTSRRRPRTIYQSRCVLGGCPMNADDMLLLATHCKVELADIMEGRLNNIVNYA